MPILLCCALIGVVPAGYSADNATVQVEEHHPFVAALPWFGTVESRHQVSVPARVNGMVVAIAVADESTVKQGDLLFTLAGKEVESKALNLQQQMDQATSAVEIAKKTLQLKRRQRQEGLATNEQVNLAAQALALAKARASTARQALATMHVGERITAPIAGVFTARAVHVGQYVRSGMVLARVVDPRQIRIRATLFAPQGMALQGTPVLIHGSQGDLRATVTAVMPETTAEGARQIWISGAALRRLPPGLAISGVLTVKHSGMAVPASAIARDDGGHRYLFIRDGTEWRRQPVTTGIRDGAMVEVVRGLHGGETVLAKGVYTMLYRDFGSRYRAPD